MAGRQRRSERDRRRRSFGQNFLVDGRLVTELAADLQLTDDELVVDLGAGLGALTIPLARAGAHVWAVERDPILAAKLAADVGQLGLGARVRVIRADLRRLRLPRDPFRVVANPPFNLTTEVLTMLLDDPSSALLRADLVLQREVARKHAAQPPKALKTAAWTPWWDFSLGRTIPSSAFRPRPSVDGTVLTVTRRDPPLLPLRLADGFTDALRSIW